MPENHTLCPGQMDVAPINEHDFFGMLLMPNRAQHTHESLK